MSRFVTWLLEDEERSRTVLAAAGIVTCLVAFVVATWATLVLL
jgi:hypothetical protein